MTWRQAGGLPLLSLCHTSIIKPVLPTSAVHEPALLHARLFITLPLSNTSAVPLRLSDPAVPPLMPTTSKHLPFILFCFLPAATWNSCSQLLITEIWCHHM